MTTKSQERRVSKQKLGIEIQRDGAKVRTLVGADKSLRLIVKRGKDELGVIRVDLSDGLPEFVIWTSRKSKMTFIHIGESLHE